MVTFPLGRILIQGDLAIIASRDGPDYVRVCPTHRWASLESVRADIQACPHCALDAEAPKGRARYDEIDRRVLDQFVNEAKP